MAGRTDQPPPCSRQGNTAAHAPQGDSLGTGRHPENADPPYGERLGKDDALSSLYANIGKVWNEKFKGWTAFFFAGNLGLTRDLGLEATARYKLYNGPIDCRLLKFPL